MTAASDEALAALASRFHQGLAELVEDPSKRSWIKLFKHMDEGQSGEITYIELAAMVRLELQLPPYDLPERMLQVAARSREIARLLPAPAFPRPMLAPAHLCPTVCLPLPSLALPCSL